MTQDAKDDRTNGHLLGGRVRYAQSRLGFRSGIEPVLLAAAVPAAPGQSVIEAGTGAGAALLCLAARVAELRGIGIERDAGLVALAQQNAETNGMAGLHFIPADMAALPDIGTFDHAFANPPYHAAAGGTASPIAAREMAKRGDADLLQVWASALGRRLRPRGTLTFILPAAMLPSCVAAFSAAACAPSAVLPLWPKAGQPAKLVLLQGVKGGRMPFRVLSGLVLHEAAGGFTAEAEAILRHGEGIAV